MASPNNLHFVLIPLMSPGHLIPMIDMAKLLAQHGVAVTIATTPLNAVKFTPTVQRAADSGLQIHLIRLKFPSVEAGLPDGCESMENLPSRNLIKNFYMAASMLQDPFEKSLQNLKPRPSCIISGKNLAWTADTARKFKIPRIFFDGMGCFSFSCSYNIEMSKIHENVSEFESFMVPNLPHRIELKKSQLPENFNSRSPDLKDVRDSMKAAEQTADGIVVNTFEELESEYVKEYKKFKGGDKIWCIGPVSACNKLNLDKSGRGQKSSINEEEILNWLNSQESGSVIYACLGSISGLTPLQLIELALGLESSNKPFIWVIRGGEKSEGLEKWISEQNFEDRIGERGFLIRGWAPQVLILSHISIGGFLTHCGWNSTLEGVCAGVPIITCPLFAEQFYNEKLVVEVLKIGVSVGVEAAVIWGQEEKFGVVMKREGVKKAVEKVLEEGEEGEGRRRRARELGKMAMAATEEGGPSYINMKMLIHYVMQETMDDQKEGC